MGHDDLLSFTIGCRRLYLYRGVIIGCTNALQKPSDQTEIFTADPNQSFIVDEPLDDVVKKLEGK
jgi:cysteine synthase